MGILQSIIYVMNKDNFIEWLFMILLFIVSSAVIDVYMYTRLFKIEVTKKQVFSTILVYIAFRYLITIFLSPLIYRLIFVAITICCFKFILHQNNEKAILGEVFNCLSIITSEIIFSKFFCMTYPGIDSYQQGIYDVKFYHAVTMSMIIFRAYLCFFIRKFNLHIDLPNRLNQKNRKKIVALSIIGCLIVFFNVVQILIDINKSEFVLFLMDIISIDIFFYISVSNIVRMNKLEEDGTRIDCLEKYNKTLGIMYDNIRGFRHDYSNFLLSLNGYVENKDIYGIKRITESALEECVDTTSMGIFDPKVINNPSIYSLLTNKFYRAKLKGVFLKVDVLMDLKDSEVGSYDISKILGILLDNAIEAAEKCDDKKVNIIFEKNLVLKAYVIRIENTYLDNNINLDKIFEKGYSTKENSALDHGLGLWNVRKILKRNKNLNLFTSKTELFTQQLEIYDKMR